MILVKVAALQWQDSAPPAYEAPSADYLQKQLQEKQEHMRSDEASACALQAAAVYAMQLQVSISHPIPVLDLDDLAMLVCSLGVLDHVFIHWDTTFTAEPSPSNKSKCVPSRNRCGCSKSRYRPPLCWSCSCGFRHSHLHPLPISRKY